jgi:hypothetical protein
VTGRRVLSRSAVTGRQQKTVGKVEAHPSAPDAMCLAEALAKADVPLSTPCDCRALAHKSASWLDRIELAIRDRV